MSPRLDPAYLRRLSMLLAMPTEDSLTVLRDMANTSPWLGPALDKLEKLPLECWQEEYTHLFINGYPTAACPPFESAYRQGQMGGTIAGDLQSLYRRAGLQATDLPADYLGTILECAAYLVETGAPEDLLTELSQDHLQHWLPRFTRDLKEYAGLEFYQRLAAELEAILAISDHD